jgi:hypothetical protein
MKLRLQHPPTPEFAAKHAQIAVEVSRDVDGINLDYSVDSLALVDRIIGAFHTEGLKTGQMGETCFTFGCYVGEVFVRTVGARWTEPKQSFFSKMGFVDTAMMVVEMPNGAIWNPIGKVFKLLESGPTESVAYLYRVATSR